PSYPFEKHYTNYLYQYASFGLANSTLGTTRGFDFGNGILSRFRIKRVSNGIFSNSNKEPDFLEPKGWQKIEFDFEGKTFSLYNVHLTSIGESNIEYQVNELYDDIVSKDKNEYIIV